MEKLDTKGVEGPGIWINLWHAIGLLFWVILVRFLSRIEIINPQNIPRQGERGVLLCSNHISAIDPFVIAATSMPFFSAVWWRAPAKEELFEYPVIRNLLATWGAFPVRRGKRDLEAAGKMARFVSSGVVVIFPEGKRSTDQGLLPGKAGVGKIIYDARPSKVIPVRIEGSDRMLPKGRILPRLFQRMRIHYGRPLDFSDLLVQGVSVELSREIVDRVMEGIAKLAVDSGRDEGGLTSGTRMP